MSIASEITRLQNAKSALKTAINAKGGSLTNETLDQYASAVDNISVAKPTLNAPTISITGDTLTITPNTNNGNFVTGYKVYSDGSLIATIQTTTLDLSTYLTTPATYSITVKAYGINFNDSVASGSEDYVISDAAMVDVLIKDGGGYGSYSLYDGQDDTGAMFDWYGVDENPIVEVTSGYLYMSVHSYNGNKRWVYDLTVTGEGTLISETRIGGNGQYLFKIDGNTTIRATMKCYVKDTPITLADGTYKLVQDITYQDDLLVWDFDKTEFASAKPIWIQKQKQATKYNHLVFSDGSELNTVNQHRIFNVEKGMFTYPMTDDTPIGTTTFNDKGEYVTLVSKEVITKEVEYYNIITDYHMNLFAGTILTSCRLSNLYPIENMTYQKDDRELHDLSLFSELDDKWIKGLRLLEQPLEINRDNAVKFDNSLVEYVKRLERDMQ